MTPHPDRPTDPSTRGEHRRPSAHQPGAHPAPRPYGTYGTHRPHEPATVPANERAVPQADGEP